MPTPSPTLYPSSTLFPELPGVSLTPYGERLYNMLAIPGLSDRGFPEEHDDLGKLCDALAAPFEQGEFARGMGTDYEPYEQTLSPNLAQGWLLKWLAQFVGETIPVGSIDAEARAVILAKRHQLRGQPETIKETVRAFLTGTKSVYLQEQADGNPFFFRIYLVSGQAPADLTALKRAVAAVKPGGYTFQVIVSTGLVYNLASGTYNAAQGPIDNPGSPPA